MIVRGRARLLSAHFGANGSRLVAFRRPLLRSVFKAYSRQDAAFRTAWMHTPVGLAILNRHGHVERMNPAMETLLGYPATAWRGAPFGYFAHPDEAHALRECVGELMAGRRRTAQLEQRFRRQDGASLVAKVTLSAIREGTRPPIGLVATCEDVTALRETERASRQREAHLRDLFEAVPVGLFHAALDRPILSMNQPVRQLLAYERGEGASPLTRP